jgi:hypothetical protein
LSFRRPEEYEVELASSRARRIFAFSFVPATGDADDALLRHAIKAA